VSLLVITITLPSRHYIGNESAAATGLLCAFTSLVLGWWGVPWGPVYTVQSLFRNARGGIKMAVGDVLAASAEGPPSAQEVPTETVSIVDDRE
jgi:hypothetical protein